MQLNERAIWKYALTADFSQKLSVPHTRKPLFVNRQGKTVCIWFEVNPQSLKSEVEVFTMPTGALFVDAAVGEYVNSIVFEDKGLVLHYYVRNV